MSRENPLHMVERSAPHRRLDFEKLLTDLPARFVALPPEEVDHEIQRALKKILEFFRIERCSLLRRLPGKTSWQLTHNAAAEGISLYPIRTPTPISAGLICDYSKTLTLGFAYTFLDAGKAPITRPEVRWQGRYPANIPPTMSILSGSVQSIDSELTGYVRTEKGFHELNQ